MKISDILTKENVWTASEKLGIPINSRHWKWYSHKLKKVECMCPVTAYIEANITKEFDPSSAEPGEDEYSCKQAAKLLNVTFDEVYGFIIGFDGNDLRDPYPKTHDRYLGWLHGKLLRSQLAEMGVDFSVRHGY